MGRVEPVEARLMFMAGLLLLGLATIAWFFPRAFTYPLIVLMVWVSLALLYRAYRLRHEKAVLSSKTGSKTGSNPETVELKQRE